MKNITYVALMYSFGRGCGKPLGSPKLSPYPQVSKRLDDLGHRKSKNESDKAHCMRFLDVIKATAAGHGKKKTVKKENTWKPSADTKNVKSDSFLQSYEWRRIRMVALKKHGATCQCCGASPKTGAVMNVDHIKPRKLFPDLALDVNNLQVLCHECNHGKGNWDKTDWRQV